jgi:hypothetical protein
MDGGGKLWIFDGLGKLSATDREACLLNDLWEFNLASDERTLMGGASVAPTSLPAD